MAIGIVTLSPDQWQPYKALRLEALRTEPQAFGASYEENAQQPDAYWKERLDTAAEGRRSWLLFAQDGDRLVGMIGAYAVEGSGVAEVISMYVSAAYRGHGVARALMAAMLEALDKATGFPCVRLAVNLDQAPAVALYRGFGFEDQDEKTVRMGDGHLHREVFMERRR